jgi:hypothetical protein
MLGVRVIFAVYVVVIVAGLACGIGLGLLGQ